MDRTIGGSYHDNLNVKDVEYRTNVILRVIKAILPVRYKFMSPRPTMKRRNWFRQLLESSYLIFFY